MPGSLHTGTREGNGVMQISLARLDSDKACMGGGMSDRDGTPHTGYADEIL